MKHLLKEIIVNWKKEPQFGGNIIYMSPDEYIDRVHIKNKLSAKEILEYENRAKKAGLKGILYYPPESKTSQDFLKKAMLYGKALDIPWIEYDAQGKLKSQEGYNRALAAKSLGIKQIPVEILPRVLVKEQPAPKEYKITHKGENYRFNVQGLEADGKWRLQSSFDTKEEAEEWIKSRQPTPTGAGKTHLV